MSLAPASDGTALIIASGVIGIIFAVFQLQMVRRIDIHFKGRSDNETPLRVDEKKEKDVKDQLKSIYDTVTEGAKAFLFAEYMVCAVFIVLFAALLVVAVSHVGGDAKWDWTFGGLSALSFVLGACTSIISGYIGMMVAVFSNARTAVQAMENHGVSGPARVAAQWKESFNTAFRAGGVMGFSLCGLALLMVFVIIRVYAQEYSLEQDFFFNGKTMSGRFTMAKMLFEAVAGFGLGGSCIALFGRVGGGIYTKAADVGADIAGKVNNDLPEDDPRNPAGIADNVGDNVGDVAGMGSDLFGSFGEATCAALVIGASSFEIVNSGMNALLFPLYISAAGILVCLVTSFVATNLAPVNSEASVERVLKVQIGVSTLLMTAALYPLCSAFLPKNAHFACDFDPTSADGAFLEVASFSDITEDVMQKSCNFNKGNAVSNLPLYAFISVGCGLWGGCLIGFITEYYTSHSYEPVRELAQSCETGAATNIIYGLALGYKSVIAPATIIAATVYVSFSLLGMYGIALSALGMLATLATCLSIDVYGPVCDNAGGLAEMSGMSEEVREKTDALDAAGNTTAAIGKGFAIGSAALVSLALFGAFVTRYSAATNTSVVNMLAPITFAFLIMGAMLPYWFTALTMKSVGVAAMEMVLNVKEQIQMYDLTTPVIDGPTLAEASGMHAAEQKTQLSAEKHQQILRYTAMKQKYSELGDLTPGAPTVWRLEGEEGQEIKVFYPRPDYARCIKISTDASLREMVPPGMLVMLTPIIVGAIFGVEAVSGLLAGSLVSSLQLAISASNSGGAWDNAKKYIESEGIRVNDGKDLQKKNSDAHKAAVVGDTVGDPLKDTSGPALNIVMKLMAIISLVFCGFFVSINEGRGVLNIAVSV